MVRNGGSFQAQLNGMVGGRLLVDQPNTHTFFLSGSRNTWKGIAG